LVTTNWAEATCQSIKAANKAGKARTEVEILGHVITMHQEHCAIRDSPNGGIFGTRCSL
jgi:hypothetical protein